MGQGRRDAQGARPGITYAVIIAGTVMVLIDTTAVNVGLAKIGRELNAEASVRWIVSAYLLAVITSQPLSGWLANRFGAKRVFLGSVTMFTVASVGSALSPNLGTLITCRALQGLGSGAILPVGLAMVLGMYPKHRHGRTLAIWGMVAMIGPALGPTLGGYVTTVLSWHWLFLINVPLGFVTVMAGLRLMPRFPTQPGGSLDAWGIVLATSGLSATVLGLSEARRWGWRSLPTMLALTAGALLIAAFVVHVLHTENPIFDIRIFGVHSFGLAMLITFGYLIGQTARIVFLPLQLQTLQGLSSLRVGMLFVPAVACQALAFPISGRISDRVGRRVPVMLGTGVATIGLIGLARQSATTPIAIVVAFVALQAVGSGLCGPPTMAAVGDLSGGSVAHGSAARALIQQVSGVVAVAGLGALVDGGLRPGQSPAEVQSAYNLAYAGAAACALVAFLLATRLARGGNEQPVAADGAPRPLDAELAPAPIT